MGPSIGIKYFIGHSLILETSRKIFAKITVYLRTLPGEMENQQKSLYRSPKYLIGKLNITLETHGGRTPDFIRKHRIE